MNQFLNETKKYQMGSGPGLDFSKEETGGRVAGFVFETDDLGVLKTIGYDHIDLVPPFLCKMYHI